MAYDRDLETSKEKMKSHNDALKSAARARLDKVADQKRRKKAEKAAK